MLKIEPLQPQQIEAAKDVITTVAAHIYEPDKPVADFQEMLRYRRILEDVDNFQEVYFNHNGIFLAVLDDEQLVGTGALKQIDAETAELKRLWLLEQYHGRKIGYAIVQRLFAFAREKGYQRIRLQTGHEQVRALAFYKKLGFYQIPSYNGAEDEVSLEIKL
jgi:putative acetyltransferase